MQEIIDLEKLITYNNLFKGRTDVFAMRWEKGKKPMVHPADILLSA
jgi:hypothetical protein